MTTKSEFRPLAVALGCGETSAYPLVGVPVLHGAPTECVFPGAIPFGSSASFALSRDGSWLLGFAKASTSGGDNLERETRRLYSELFHAAAGWHLSRIWNYVPAINEAGAAGLENYRAFCRGRSLAFEDAFGPEFKRYLPAASAVGTDGGELAVVFAACSTRARHVENPSQTPAYEYPASYGPRPPSFARATVVAEADSTTIFFSGTSAICGHATVAPYETCAQLDCTLANLRIISTACGSGADLGGDHARSRHFKVYLRHAGDFAAVAARLGKTLLRPGDTVSYLRADICRRELNVEIEATVRGRFSAAD